MVVLQHFIQSQNLSNMKLQMFVNHTLVEILDLSKESFYNSDYLDKIKTELTLKHHNLIKASGAQPHFDLLSPRVKKRRSYELPLL